MPVKYTPEQRIITFWEKVNKDGPISQYSPDGEPCWIWKPAPGNNYGQVKSHPKALAHRFSYELLIGPIDPLLEIDHLCQVKPCVRPSHLEQVTHSVNSARALARHGGSWVIPGTHCRKGHEFSPENTWSDKRRNNIRVCKKCHSIRETARVKAIRAAARTSKAANQ